MNEFQFKQCKVCKEIKKRFFAGYYPNGKDRRWVDEEDKEWMGTRCAACHKQTSKENMRTKRFKEKISK